MTTIRRGFTLDNERDAAILLRLDAEENTSAVVREALRAHYGLAVTLADVLQAIHDLQLATPLTTAPADEDVDLVAALDALGL